MTAYRYEFSLEIEIFLVNPVTNRKITNNKTQEASLRTQCICIGSFCPRWVVAHTWPFRKVTWRNTIPTLILLLQTLYIFIYSFISNIYAGWPSSALSWFDQVACLPLEWLMFNFSWQYPLKTCIHKPVEFVFWIVLLPVETKNKNHSVPVCLC